jgi:hypothetical protein
MNELRRRRVAADIESQTSRPVPKEINVPELVTVAIVVLIVAVLILWGT